MNKEFLWVERYRPQTINDCILSQRYLDKFNAYVVEGEIPNLLLVGDSGMGKTTIARALCRELGADMLFIKASEDGNIDTLRTTIRKFASTISLNGGLKVVILDESDYLNVNSTQPALRSFIEEFSTNCRFIFTANFSNRIIKPLRSRLTEVEFKFSKQESAVLAAQFMKRVKQILKENDVEFDLKIVAEIIMQYFPDFRKVLSELQGFSSVGIVGDVMSQIPDSSLDKLMEFLKHKEYTKMRRWVGEHSDYDPIVIMRRVVDHAHSPTSVFKKETLPALILAMAEHDYRMAFCADKEIMLSSFFTTLFYDCEFV